MSELDKVALPLVSLVERLVEEGETYDRAYDRVATACRKLIQSGLMALVEEGDSLYLVRTEAGQAVYGDDKAILRAVHAGGN